ncbi:MAG: biotin--[acetyl-CoA-carboxylase] ligase [Bauldia sp.]
MADRTALPAGWRRQHHDSVSSTNALAMAAARAGDPGGLWVTAGEQVAGRGRRGRTWVSARGNLHASLLLLDPARPEAAASISYVAGLALHDALTALAGPLAGERFRLKWPNDILCDARKVAGILVEGETLPDKRLAVVIGIGVNCIAHPGLGDALPSGDLASLGLPVDCEPLFYELARRMADGLARWDRGRGFAAIRTEWLGRATGLGRPIRARLYDRVIDGRFDDIDAQGRLILCHADGSREALSAADVFFAPTSPARPDGGGVHVGEPA